MFVISNGVLKVSSLGEAHLLEYMYGYIYVSEYSVYI